MDHRTGLLSTEKVTLKPFGIEFLSEAYVDWLNDPIVTRFSEQRHRKHDRETCLAFMRRFDQVTSHFWAICTPQGRHVGTITAVRDMPNCTADVGILVGVQDLHNKGIGTAAWAIVCAWLFATGTRKVTAGAMAVNESMLQVFAKAGMVVEGRQRSQFMWEGQEVDLVFAAAFAK